MSFSVFPYLKTRVVLLSGVIFQMVEGNITI